MKNRIKAFLEERGISVYRFQKDTGIAASTAYNLAGRPDQLPSSTVLTKICDAYEVQPNEILIWVKPSEE